MAVLNWNQIGERFYETGVDRGVFYPTTGEPSVWNGLVSVTENPSGGEPTPIYVDGQKIYDLMQSEDFSADIESYSPPTAFLACDGFSSIAPGLFATQQPRSRFGFSYRTRIGNDLKLTDYGYKIHLIYNATASPISRTNKSTSSSVDVSPLKWTINTVPPKSLTYKPTAHLIIDSTGLTAAKLLTVENLLYGTASTAGSLPTQAALVALLTAP